MNVATISRAVFSEGSAKGPDPRTVLQVAMVDITAIASDA
jgi:hypothetical protein